MRLWVCMWQLKVEWMNEWREGREGFVEGFSLHYMILFSSLGRWVCLLCGLWLFVGGHCVGVLFCGYWWFFWMRFCVVRKLTELHALGGCFERVKKMGGWFWIVVVVDVVLLWWRMLWKIVANGVTTVVFESNWKLMGMSNYRMEIIKRCGIFLSLTPQFEATKNWCYGKRTICCSIPCHSISFHPSNSKHIFSFAVDS